MSKRTTTGVNAVAWFYSRPGFGSARQLPGEQATRPTCGALRGCESVVDKGHWFCKAGHKNAPEATSCKARS